MTKTEKRLLGFCVAFMGSILIVNPQLMLTSLSVFTRPSNLFHFNPWYYPAPFLGLVALIIIFGFYNRATPKYRIIIWLLSFIYWGAWVIHFIMDLSPFIEYWIIWGPHLAIALASLAGINVVKRPNKASQPTLNFPR
jgi:hypothetical protein